MDADAVNDMEWGRRHRLYEALDRMVASGRVTETEAQRLRAAAEPTEFNKAVRDIRIRHAGLKLDAASRTAPSPARKPTVFLIGSAAGSMGAFSVRIWVRSARGGVSRRRGLRPQVHEDVST
jgi:hypothetical protein